MYCIGVTLQGQGPSCVLYRKHVEGTEHREKLDACPCWDLIKG